MKVSLGSDQAEHPVVKSIERALISLGHEVVHVEANGGSWVDVGRQVGQSVADRESRRGITCCSTGTGVAIAANKVPGVRAAVCGDAEMARAVRLFNHTNVLALSLDRTPLAEVGDIVSTWLKTPPGADERDSVDRLEV